MKKKKARAKTPKKTKARKAVKSKVKAKKTSAKRPPAKAKKKAKKKAVAAPPRKGVIPPVNGVLLGFVEDYFAKIGVIALTLKAGVAQGQKIQILGHTTNFEQIVDSMQIDHLSVAQAGPRDSVGIKVRDRARTGDHVYLLK